MTNLPTAAAPAPIAANPGETRSDSSLFRLPRARINWTTSSFLIGTLALTLTAVPAYLWYFGLDWFQVALFFVMFAACGFSISIGYHRLFSHIAFQAAWPVRLFTLIFGAAAFENSVLMWASEHRRHHKHVDHDDDPYSISKGFFYAHVGWLIFKLHPEGPYDNVNDLRKDPLVVCRTVTFSGSPSSSASSFRRCWVFFGTAGPARWVRSCLRASLGSWLCSIAPFSLTAPATS